MLNLIHCIQNKRNIFSSSSDKYFIQTVMQIRFQILTEATETDRSFDV